MKCPYCGLENPDTARFCQSCGASLIAPAGRPKETTGMQSNVAGLLCYLAWWVTGIIFLLIEKEDQFVRFHAMQSIITFGAFTGMFIILSILQIIPVAGVIFTVLEALVGVFAFIVWILLMVKAYQGQRFKLPWAGDMAERQLG